jgi:erythronate-4-phosphate dehydrogenase
MILAVDEVIPYWQEAFAGFGEVRPYAAGKLRPAHIRDADAIVVRSITSVNAALLDGSNVRFVGTASIGMDHLDLDYLGSRNLFVTNAAGSNANSVAEYVVATLLVVAHRRGWNLGRKSLAVIGVGNVGSRVAEKARALGIEVMLCDPPLREATGDPRYRSLEDVLGADIITFHVPLTRTGPYPTWRMLDRGVIERLSSRSFVMNSARGAVFDNSVLRQALQSGQIEGAALDVWDDEPNVDFELLDLVDIGTGHIAGYSLDGKVRATEMILQELCRFFGIEAAWDTSHLFPSPSRIELSAGTQTAQDVVRSAVLHAYNILEDDARLRSLRPLDRASAAAEFHRQRNGYHFRPEFRHYVVEWDRKDEPTAVTLRALGFVAGTRAQGI